MLRLSPVILILASVVICCNSCKKETEDQLINGIWSLEQVYFDTSTSNYLNTYPEFTQGNSCCYYNMNFEDNGVVLAYYEVHDSIKYLVSGTWSLPDYNNVYIKCDNFMDGNFSISKPSLKHWELVSTANHISLFDSTASVFDTAYTKLEIYKN
jgi:hypothetical protein